MEISCNRYENANSDIRMKYQKSAEVILTNWIYTICEGLNDRRIFFMKGNQEYNNGRQLHIEDYLQDNKLETESIAKVLSILDVSPFKEIDTKTVTNELLEKTEKGTPQGRKHLTNIE